MLHTRRQQGCFNSASSPAISCTRLTDASQSCTWLVENDVKARCKVENDEKVRFDPIKFLGREEGE